MGGTWAGDGLFLLNLYLKQEGNLDWVEPGLGMPVSIAFVIKKETNQDWMEPGLGCAVSIQFLIKK